MKFNKIEILRWLLQKKKENNMPQNFYELTWIFIVYAFIGWCAEVAYAALDTGKFVNRGFLNGPYCPIYGCGVVIVVGALTPLKGNLLILFLGSFLLTSLLEFVTGFILEKAFHNKWWDYSDKPFNIKGYVCLKFSIYWGFACVFIMDILHPIIYKGITCIPYILGMILLIIFLGVFIVDLFITVSTILKLNKRLRMMDEIAAQIHKISDEIGENIYENVAEAIEKSEKFQEEHAELLEKVSERKETIKDLPETAKLRIAEEIEETKTRMNESAEEAKAKISESAETARAIITESIEQTKAEWNERTEEARKNYEEKKKRREALSEEYKHLFENKNYGTRRLLKAFPKMKSRDNNEILEKLKENLTK